MTSFASTRSAYDAARCANPRCHKGEGAEPVYGRQVICDYCAGRVGRQLVDLAWAHDDLETVLAASSQTARFDSVSGSRTPPVPVRLDVADHRDEIRSILVSWTKLVVEERGLSQWPPNSVHDLAEFLEAQLDWLAEHPAAGDLCDEIARALGRAYGLLDSPGAVCVVPCPGADRGTCEGRLRVTADTAWVRCQVCGFETDNLPWLGQLLRGGESTLVTAVEACHRLRAEDIQIRPVTIRSWVKRKKVVARDRDEAGRLLYEMNELRALAQPGKATPSTPPPTAA